MQPNAHTTIDQPSVWVQRWAALISAGSRVLDVACGGGRHARWFAAQGYRVDAVDRDASALSALAGITGVTSRIADLEIGEWPYANEKFAGIVVVNYLHRPLFPRLLASLDRGGVLIYETFAAGNERYGRPKNPDFLLKPGELLQIAHGQLEVIAYENLTVNMPRPAVLQRMCALNGPGAENVGE
jgi:SAM-dependent methyltransferase